jgi:hypothetical protein
MAIPGYNYYYRSDPVSQLQGTLPRYFKDPGCSVRPKSDSI